MATSVLVQLLVLALAGSNSAGLDDKKLSGLIKNGDHKAFKAFFEAHHDALYRFLVSRGTDRVVAQDLIQKAFIYIWENRHRIDETKSLRAYLFKITYTRMLNHIRDRAKFSGPDGLPENGTASNPEEFAQAQQLTEAVERAIQAMPEKRKMVFEFCFLQEFTYRETAQALDVSVKTVENHMGLALKDIRSALQVFDQKPG